MRWIVSRIECCFCFLDENENEFGGGKGTGNNIMHSYLQDHIMEKQLTASILNSCQYSN